MIGQAGETEFDIHFRIFGIYVRIHPLFWVMAAFVVWRASPTPAMKLLGVLCVLLSILVHELGHAVFIRRWGYSSEIVLYGMGGYATSRFFSTWKSVWISFAGPLFGFLLYGVSWAVVYLLAKTSPDILMNQNMLYTLDMLLWINLWWGVLNLLPILPLDGGRIAEAILTRYVKRGVELTLQLSILTSGAVAYWAYTDERRFLMIMMILFCAQNVMVYNEQKGRSGR